MFVKKGDVTRRREGEYPQSCAMRMTAPSADAGFRACGYDQRTEPVWRLCDRPLEAFARSRFKLCGGQRWQVAAALSAAVTTTQQQETAPNSQGQIV